MNADDSTGRWLATKGGCLFAAAVTALIVAGLVYMLVQLHGMIPRAQ